MRRSEGEGEGAERAKEGARGREDGSRVLSTLELCDVFCPGHDSSLCVHAPFVLRLQMSKDTVLRLCKKSELLENTSNVNGSPGYNQVGGG